MKGRTIQTNEIRQLLYFVNHKETLNRKQQAKRNELLLAGVSNSHRSNNLEIVFEKIQEDIQYDDNKNIVEKSQKSERELKIRKTAIKEYIHDPLLVSSFLHKFTEMCDLKYSTHIWDKDTNGDGIEYINYDDFIKKLDAYLGSEENKKFIDLMFVAPRKYGGQSVQVIYNSHLHTILYGFLKNENNDYSWGKDKLKIGWRYPNDGQNNNILKKWMDANPQKQPFSMQLINVPESNVPKGETFNGDSFVYFGDIVEQFKHYIEFRGDDLYYMLRYKTRNSDYVVNKAKLETLMGKSFYTDTAQVEDAIDIMLSNIRSRSEHKDVEISATCYNNDEHPYLLLEILHVGSFSNKSLNDDKLNLNGGQMIDIKKKLQSLCDFYIESKFEGDKCYRITYLDRNEKDVNNTPQKTKIENCKGFKYVMKFYL